MARPKSSTKKSKPAESAAAAETDRETIINMKGSPEYAQWLEAIHRKTYIPKVQIVRLALAEWAAKNGHDAPPEI